MKIERLMFFGDSFAMEKSDKQNCWKTLLSEKLDNIPIGHWGQGGSSMESCYNDFYNYIRNFFNGIILLIWDSQEYVAQVLYQRNHYFGAKV